ncbi:hypothetical protein FN846DRAFT_952472, partial [Sphaerosporella brunnea]
MFGYPEDVASMWIEVVTLGGIKKNELNLQGIPYYPGNNEIAQTPKYTTTATISPPSTTATPPANSNAAGSSTPTDAAAADRMNRMEETLNAILARVVNVEQAVKPDVLRDIVKENSNPTGTATTICYPMQQINSIDGTLKAIETRMGNVEESVKPEVLADIIKKSSNTADSAVVMAWPRHRIESIERTVKAVEQCVKPAVLGNIIKKHTTPNNEKTAKKRRL